MKQIDPRLAKLEQRTQGVMTLMALILAVLLVQLWLLTIALEEFMAAHTALALPTFGASGFCFLLNLWLLRYLYALDKKDLSGDFQRSNLTRSRTLENVFIIDPARCIGCQSCVQACGECGTHRGTSMIHLEYINRAETVQTTPQVCMHCENPTCAQVCPADAIKQTPDGVVQSSLKPRCIGCRNCVLACPFGVPKYLSEPDQMMKCDMCYDRTSVGKRPMCATVCPSEALYFGPLEEWQKRRRGKPVNTWKFGRQTVRTNVYMVMPENAPPANAEAAVKVDVRLGDIQTLKSKETAL